MTFRVRFALFLLMLAVGGPAGAVGTFMLVPFAVDSAEVMPKGLRSLRIVGLTTEIQDRFDSSNQSVSLGNSFNQKVPMKRFLDSQPSGYAQDQLKGFLKSYGVDENESAGVTQGALDIRVSSTVPVLAYGLTEHLTLAAAIPIVTTSMSVATGWTASPALQKALNQISKNASPQARRDLSARLQNVITSQLQDNHYSALTDQTETGLGDVNLVAKYQTLKTRNWTSALTGKLILPTGRQASSDRLIDPAPGDGHFSMGVNSLWDYQVGGHWALHGSAGYLYQLPSSKAERIPVDGDGGLTPDVDSDTREKRGDILGAGLGLSYSVDPSWTLITAYTAQTKAADQYQGDQYAASRYQYLSLDTASQMQALQTGIAFSTISLFQRHEFVAPLTAGLTWTKVIAGLNVSKFDLYSFELASYF